jgi:hypothetical protein
VLACSGVVYYYITKSPKHLDDGIGNTEEEFSHEHFNLHKTRSPCFGPDGEQRNHGWHGLFVQRAIGPAHLGHIGCRGNHRISPRVGLILAGGGALVD